MKAEEYSNEYNDIKEQSLDNEQEIEIDSESDGSEEWNYPSDSIKVEKGFYSVFELKRKYDSLPRRVVLDSDFQRDDVWNYVQRSELIESILMGLPLPIFYFNQDKYGRLIVVDGRQRLTSLFQYMDDGFRLKKLKVLKHLNGVFFSELSGINRGKLEDYQIQAHVIIPPTPERIKFDIFDRVNRGGMHLNKQEIRNALYQGNATILLNSIVKGQAFEQATGGAFRNETRMKDKYLISRVIAITLYLDGKILDDEGEVYRYKGDIDDLQGKAMEFINSQDQDLISGLTEKLNNALYKSFQLFGRDAFRLRAGEKKSPINMNVFETIMTILIFRRSDIEDEFITTATENLTESEEFLDNIGNHRDGEGKFETRIGWAMKIAGGRKHNDKGIVCN